MTRCYNDPIPKAKFQQWHDILVATGGRYLSNPRDHGDVVRVDYQPGDYKRQQRMWCLINMNIVETYRMPWYKKLWCKIKQPFC